MKRSRIAVCLPLAVFLGTVISAAVVANSAPKTVLDSEIPVEHLELLVKPLTADELIVEAEGWLSILRDKVREVSLLEIEVREHEVEIEKVRGSCPHFAARLAGAEDQVENGTQPHKAAGT